MAVRSAIKSPYTRPVLPRISSATSGFFFCGMMEEPVAKPSSSSMNWNSALAQRITSSQKRERCIMEMAALERYSSRKSRSATPSSELFVIWEKPSNSRTRSRLSG